MLSLVLDQLIDSVRGTPPYMYFGDLAPGKCLHALNFFFFLNSSYSLANVFDTNILIVLNECS